MEFSITPHVSVIDRHSALSKRQAERFHAGVILNKLLSPADHSVYNIGHEDHGKPYIIERSDVNISISHSYEMLAMLLTDAFHAPGVDIECLKNRVEGIAPRFLSVEELLWVEKSSQRLDLLHILWSAKETAFKIFNPAGGNFIKSFLIRPIMRLEDEGVFSLSYKQQAIDIPINYKITDRYVLTWSNPAYKDLKNAP